MRAWILYYLAYYFEDGLDGASNYLLHVVSFSQTLFLIIMNAETLYCLANCQLQYVLILINVLSQSVTIYHPPTLAVRQTLSAIKAIHSILTFYVTDCNRCFVS